MDENAQSVRIFKIYTILTIQVGGGSIILARTGVGIFPLIRIMVQKLLCFPLCCVHVTSRSFPSNLGCHLGEVRSSSSGGVRELGAVGNNSFREYSGLM